jgi:hypothetical protein
VEDGLFQHPFTKIMGLRQNLWVDSGRVVRATVGFSEA